VDQLIRSTAWRSAGAIEGLRVLEEERGSKQRARAAALCRKMQVRPRWCDTQGPGKMV
jgi:hypothetical protein